MVTCTTPPFRAAVRLNSGVRPTIILMDSQEEIRKATVLAVRQSAVLLKAGDPLFGFALATDDDVSTLFYVACTVGWVRENERLHPGIGCMFIDWPEHIHDDIFSTISSRLNIISSQIYPSDDAWSAARDGRFNALVQALKDCRDEGLFDGQTLLCVGSTDPSEHLWALEMRAVRLLNTSAVVDRYARVNT